MAILTATTKRYPAVSSGLILAPVQHLTGLPVTPLQSVSAELALQANIQDAHEVKKTYCFTNSQGALYDVREGDILVVSGVEYAIRSAAEFNRPGDGSYIRLLIQERKITT
ncbi:MAG: hypothetical protein KJ063_02405 [Anaerolineae bacterium]|nr:hypothetical protein [Anaerolineae bacterium]